MAVPTIARMDLSAIVKAYDVRGLVPDELDAEAAFRIGAAFARFAGAPRIAVGRDCRESSPGLAEAFMSGVIAQGVDVDDLGMITTDMVYYAAGALNEPGAMITASHNPRGYNGIKLCLAGAAPVGIESGLADIRDAAAVGVDPAASPGAVTERDVLAGYVDHVASLIDPAAIRPLRVAVDGGNGVAGVAVHAVFERIPATLDGLYLEQLSSTTDAP